MKIVIGVEMIVLAVLTTHLYGIFKALEVLLVIGSSYIAVLIFETINQKIQSKIKNRIQRIIQK